MQYKTIFSTAKNIRFCKISRLLIFITLTLTFSILGISAIAANRPTDASKLPKVNIMGKTFYVYECSKGESLYSIANSHGWNEETLRSINPEASSPLAKGQVLYYPADANSDNYESKKNIGDAPETEAGDSISPNTITHTLKHGESVYAVARKYDLSIDELYNLNPQARNGVKPGDVLIISSTGRPEPIAEEKTPIIEDNNPMGRVIADENLEVIDGDATDENIGNIEQSEIPSLKPEVRLAVIVDNKDANRDMEFVRGMLLALDTYKDAPYKTLFKIIDGSEGQEQILEELSDFQPLLMVSTADKNLSGYVTDFARDNKVLIVNVFDLKNEEYTENPQIVQYLSPTNCFNADVAGYLAGRFEGYDLLIAGSPDAGDTMVTAVQNSGAFNSVVSVDASEIESFPIEGEGKYLIYATQTKKDDTSAFLEKVYELKMSNPLAEVYVLGRPNWITFADNIGSKLSDAGGMIPSRFVFNPQSPREEDFINRYKGMFGHPPVRSYPAYAASGYDVLNYFLPGIANHSFDPDGGLDSLLASKNNLQNNLRLEREGENGGLVNTLNYIIVYGPFGESTVIEL